MAAAVPPNLKGIQAYIRLAKEYDKRDPIIAYLCRFYAIQKGIKIDSKSPDCKSFLFGLMDQLEVIKKDLVGQGEEAVCNDIVGQAHIETKTVNLFTWADTQDRSGVFNKNITKSFYSANLLFDVLSQFDELSDECKVMQKYSKWKATYLHKCAQTGERPKPGPKGSGFETDLEGLNDQVMPNQGDNYPSNALPPLQPGNMATYNEPVNISGPSSPQRLFPPLQPHTQQPQQPSVPFTLPTSHLDASQINIEQVKKHCKFAISSLEYEDVNSAVDNIVKALNMLTRK